MWFAGVDVGLARFFNVAWIPLQLAVWRGAEALAVTLLGSLWFNSLGHGEWWLVFLLIGGVAATSGQRWPRPDTRATVVATCTDLTRYLIAGALLAWILG